jgi:hypothetical protein
MDGAVLEGVALHDTFQVQIMTGYLTAVNYILLI